MRYIPLVLIAVAILLPGTQLWAQQPAPSPIVPAPAIPVPPPASPGILPVEGRQIVPGKSVAGIEVGSRISAVLARMGRASEVRETAIDSVYFFNRYGITVYAQKGLVSAVSTSNSLLKVANALGPGSRVEDVTATFGTSFRKGSAEAFPAMIYDDRGVAFGLDGNGVAIVMVFRRGTAGQISGLVPGAGVGMQSPIAGFPSVAGLKPFSPESDYMSLSGYLRWLVYQASGNWITFAEATRVVQEQRGASR